MNTSSYTLNPLVFDLLLKLKELNIRLFLEDGQLKFSAPKGTMSNELLGQLKELKSDLTVLVGHDELGKSLLANNIPALDAEIEGYPLTFAQQRFWFLDQLAGGNSPIYNMLPIVFEARGTLHMDVMKEVFNEIITRHKVLSYRFGYHKGEPRQWPGNSKNVEFTVYKLDTKSESEEQIQEIILSEGEKPFDLQSGTPLIRMGIIELSDVHHILILTLHHICADGWSLGQLSMELSSLYDARIRGKKISLPPINIQYGDYAHWERNYLDKLRLQQKMLKWMDLLSEAPTFLELPTDRPRPRLQSFNGNTHAFTLDAQATKNIYRLSRESGCTPFMILVSIFGILLAKYSRQDDIVVGSPISNRIHSQTQPLIGLFLNTIPLRIRLHDNPDFNEVLRRVKKMSITAFEMADVPFDEILQALNIERSLNHTPLFQVLFALQNTPNETFKAGDLELHELEPENSKAPFDLVLSMEENNEKIHGRFRYNTDLFDALTISRLSGHFVQLLHILIENPGTNVMEVSVTTPDEIEQLKQHRGGTQSFTSTKTIHECISDIANRFPDNTAIRYNGQSYSYTWLKRRSQIISGILLQHGVKHQNRVGVFMDRSPDLIATLWAIIGVGATYVPLDPVYPADRLTFMIEDADLKVVVSDRQSHHELPDAGQVVILVDDIIDTNIEVFNETDFQISDTSTDDPLYVIYTSGSTGLPKGVEITNHNVLRLFSATEQLYQFSEDDKWTLFHSYAFDFSVWEIFGALLYGGTLVIVPRSISRTPDTFFKLIIDEKVTVLNQTPSAFAQLAEVDRQAGGPDNSLKWIIFGGEALDPASLKGWFERHGYDNPTLVNMYGITETTVHVTWQIIKQTDVKEGASLIGVPISDLTLDLCDEYGQLVGFGIPGEILVGGAGVAQGYLNRPELNQERFVTKSLYADQSPTKMYRSGDLARRRNDGSLQYLGRIDFQVKIRGFRIELGEIENQFVTFEGVASAAVKVINVASGNELAGYVVFQRDYDPDIQLQKLRDHLRNKLPEYMVPAAIVVLNDMPLTPNGKTDLKALPDPGRENRVQTTDYVAPRNSLEKQIAEFWQDILGIDQVGVHDNFFELGGDSIKGAVFANRMQEELGSIFYVVAIFEAPTISQLFDYIKVHYPEILEKFSDIDHRQSSSSDRLMPRDWNVINELVPPLTDYPPIKDIPRNPKAIFVLAPPRSGTTLLRVLMGGHSKLFAPPELELMPFNTMNERADTYTGRDSFWLEGTIRAYMEARNIGLEEAKFEILKYEQAGMSVQEFYAVLQNLIPGKILVDKSPSYVLHQSILDRIENTFDEPVYIHLHRHPLGMIHSFEEAKLHQIFFRYKNSYNPRQLGELIWSYSHQNIRSFLKGIPSVRQTSISFEKMTSDAETEMHRLCELIGLDFEPGMLSLYQDSERKKRMTDGIHAESRMLGDVKFHTHKKIDPNASDRWKEKYGVEILGDFTREIGIELGYDLPKPIKQIVNIINRSENKYKSAFFEKNGSHVFSDIDEKSVRPLSQAQQRLWFFDQLEKGSATYNMPVNLRISGEMNIQALQKAMNLIQIRHEVLRSYIRAYDEIPVSVIRETPSLTSVIDLTFLDTHLQQSEIDRWISDFSSMPFSLEYGPLFQSVVLKCNSEEFILLINMHHIVSDGWSLGLLSKELESAYTAYCSESEPDLVRLNATYSDYTLWQNDLVKSGEIQRQIDYWKSKLHDLPPLLELPTDRPRPAIKTYRGATHRFELDQDQTRIVKSLADSLQVTPYMVLLAIFGTLLHKYTGKNDIPIGTPLANRRKTEFESLIGFFVNTQVLRMDVQSERSFVDIVSQSKQLALEALSNQDVSFEHLVEALQPNRNMGYSPLFQVMLTMQTGKISPPKLPSLHTEIFEHENTISKYDLTLLFAEEKNVLACYAEYSTDIFDEWRIKQLASHFAQLIQEIASNPNVPIKKLNILTPSEKQNIIHDWNQTDSTFDLNTSVPELILAHARKNPDKIAIRARNGELTYRELVEKSQHVANQIIALDLPKGSLILVSCGRTSELIVGMLAIWKAGHTYVPVDPNFPTQRIQMIIEDANASVVLTDHETYSVIPDSIRKFLIGDMIGTSDDDIIDVPLDLAPLAYVIFTSGSTGRPKGVMVEHTAVTNFLLSTSEILNITHEDVVLSITTISFDIAVLEIWGYLINGATVELACEETVKNAELLIHRLQSDTITVMQATPATWTMIIDAGWNGSETFTAITGGEALSKQLAAKLVPRSGIVWNMYGPTETTVYSTIARIGQADIQNNQPIPIGRPIHNTSIYILDENGLPVPAGYPGTLFIGGLGVAQGYLNRPDLTDEKFIPDPFASSIFQESRFLDVNKPIMYNTGDLAQYRNDGTIEYLGRKDQQIKLRGYRIELEEIEHHLNSIPDVSKAAVVLNETNGITRLVAYMVSASSVNPETSTITTKLRDHLPEYMIPTVFQWIATLPLTPNGKLDRNNLSKRPIELLNDNHNQKSPRDVFEIKVSSIWKSVLGISQVGLEDNFFELGGHSLLAVKLMAEINAGFGAHLPLAVLFQNPTFESFSDKLRNSIREGFTWSGVVPLTPTKNTSKILYLIPGAGGNIVYLQHLALLIDPETEVYALQPPGLDGKTPPLTNVTDLAEYYINSIEDQVKGKQFTLVGHSFGGLVAYEISRLMENYSDEISKPRLVILDTAAPQWFEPTGLDWSTGTWFNQIAKIASHQFGTELNWDYNSVETDHFDDADLISKLLDSLIDAGIFPNGTDADFLKGFVDVYRSNLKMEYNPKSVLNSTQITLIRAKDLQPEHLNDPKVHQIRSNHDLGWSQWSKEKVNLVEVPGDHLTMLNPPQVQHLAEELNKIIATDEKI